MLPMPMFLCPSFAYRYRLKYITNVYLPSGMFVAVFLFAPKYGILLRRT